VDLILPHAHPLSDLLGGPDQQFMLCNGVKIHGDYRSHYQYSSLTASDSIRIASHNTDMLCNGVNMHGAYR
jgi:hypothetical protein